MVKPQVEKAKSESIVNFSEVYRGTLGALPITELLNIEFIIEDVEFTKLERYGDVGVITANIGGHKDKYYTFSKVIIKQLKEIEHLIKEGKKVKATLKRIKNYYTLA